LVSASTLQTEDSQDACRSPSKRVARQPHGNDSSITDRDSSGFCTPNIGIDRAIEDVDVPVLRTSMGTYGVSELAPLVKRSPSKPVCRIATSARRPQMPSARATDAVSRFRLETELQELDATSLSESSLPAF
jgi:hypothetical protein